MTNLVDEMLQATKKDVAVFQQFILDYKEHTNTLFYFVEGKDFCYYNPRIKLYCKNYDIMHYICGGKEHVIGVNELIKKNVTCIEGNKILYFIDRDYGLNIDSIDKGIYVTDFYSIENYYLNKKTVERILTEFMEIDVHTENFHKAMDFYEKSFKEYSNFGKNLNAFIYTVRVFEKENCLERTDFNRKKFNSFLNNNSIVNYSFNEYSFKQFKELFDISFEIEEDRYTSNLLKFSILDHSNYRGKYELAFLKSFLNLIKSNIKAETNGFKKCDLCSIDFNCETMKLFTDYAMTTQSLINYLKVS